MQVANNVANCLETLSFTCRVLVSEQARTT